MSNVEKEVRFKIKERDISKIKDNTTSYKPRQRMIDITCGKYGFDSLKKLGYIGRIRCKENQCKIEVKNYMSKNECIEKSLVINDIKDGIEFFGLLDMKPYLIIDRYREVRKLKNLKIFIDELELIGAYIEIEYQDATKTEMIDFINQLGLEPIEQEKYGDIISHQINTDEKFKSKHLKKLKKYSDIK